MYFFLLWFFVLCISLFFFYIFMRQLSSVLSEIKAWNSTALRSHPDSVLKTSCYHILSGKLIGWILKFCVYVFFCFTFHKTHNSFDWRARATASSPHFDDIILVLTCEINSNLVKKRSEIFFVEIDFIFFFRWIRLISWKYLKKNICKFTSFKSVITVFFKLFCLWKIHNSLFAGCWIVNRF